MYQNTRKKKCPECRQTTTTSNIFRIFFQTISHNELEDVNTDIEQLQNKIKSYENLIQHLKRNNEILERDAAKFENTIKNLERKTTELHINEQKLNKTVSVTN